MSSKQASDQLLEAIAEIVFKKGPKATTMDSVAQSLSMSKRTLYEIFDNKMDMLLKALSHHRALHKIKIEEIFRTSDNVMEALFRTFEFHRLFMESTNVDFFRDMDERYPEVRRNFDDGGSWDTKIYQVIDLGIEQGVFLPNLNYEVILHLFRIQMESLKRMEEHFPPEISFTDALDTICIGFLRSIASSKGREILDSICIARKSECDRAGIY